MHNGLILEDERVIVLLNGFAFIEDSEVLYFWIVISSYFLSELSTAGDTGD